MEYLGARNAKRSHFSGQFSAKQRDQMVSLVDDSDSDSDSEQLSRRREEGEQERVCCPPRAKQREKRRRNKWALMMFWLGRFERASVGTIWGGLARVAGATRSAQLQEGGPKGRRACRFQLAVCRLQFAVCWLHLPTASCNLQRAGQSAAAGTCYCFCYHLFCSKKCAFCCTLCCKCALTLLTLLTLLTVCSVSLRPKSWPETRSAHQAEADQAERPKLQAFLF